MSSSQRYLSIFQAFGLLGIEVVILIVCSPLVFILLKYTNMEITQFVYYLITALLTLFIFIRIKMKNVGNSDFCYKKHNIKQLTVMVVGGYTLLFGVIFPLSDLMPIPEVLSQLFSQSLPTGYLTFILMVIIAPILEEMLYRGIILDGLLLKYSPITSIIISSIIFTIAHFNPSQLIAAFIAGIYLGLIYYWTKNLLITTLIHACINVIGYLQIVFFQEEISHNYRYLDILKNNYLYATIIIICISVFGLCMRYIVKKQSRLLKT